MNDNYINTVKLFYSTPVIDKINIDNEISLALESTPPLGPNESSLYSTDNNINDPFKAFVNLKTI